MSEETQNSEDFIKDSFQKSGIAERRKNENRIAKILYQARRNVGSRDFILLVFVRFWMVLAEIACKIIACQSKDKDVNPKNSKIRP